MIFESAVRPFQLFQALRLGRLVPSPATSAPPPGGAFIAWGAAGTMPTPQSTQYQVEHCQRQNDETARQSDLIRIDIQDPDSDTPHVMVERPHQIKFKTSHKMDPLPDTSFMPELNAEGDTGIENDLNQLSADFDNSNWLKGIDSVLGNDECKLTVNLHNGASSA